MGNTLITRWQGKLSHRMPVVLDIGAAMLLSEGANLIYAPAGWITAGFALIVINWRIYGD
ncbi:hypothetical protein [Streptomyces sp. NPDC058603]|uniref:hypothetical protein n=1 Tax=Streptomyces sp. NPDC058603 TaxID=3346551 RepID=UPI00364E3DF8